MAKRGAGDVAKQGFAASVGVGGHGDAVRGAVVVLEKAAGAQQGLKAGVDAGEELGQVRVARRSGRSGAGQRGEQRRAQPTAVEGSVPEVRDLNRRCMVRAGWRIALVAPAGARKTRAVATRSGAGSGQGLILSARCHGSMPVLTGLPFAFQVPMPSSRMVTFWKPAAWSLVASSPDSAWGQAQ